MAKLAWTRGGSRLVVGDTLDPSLVNAAGAGVADTAVPAAFWADGHLFDIVVLRCPRNVGVFAPSCAEWIVVVVGGGWLDCATVTPSRRRIVLPVHSSRAGLAPRCHGGWHRNSRGALLVRGLLQLVVAARGCRCALTGPQPSRRRAKCREASPVTVLGTTVELPTASRRRRHTFGAFAEARDALKALEGDAAVQSRARDASEPLVAAIVASVAALAATPQALGNARARPSRRRAAIATASIDRQLVCLGASFAKAAYADQAASACASAAAGFPRASTRWWRAAHDAIALAPLPRTAVLVAGAAQSWNAFAPATGKHRIACLGGVARFAFEARRPAPPLDAGLTTEADAGSLARHALEDERVHTQHGTVGLGFADRIGRAYPHLLRQGIGRPQPRAGLVHPGLGPADSVDADASAAVAAAGRTWLTQGNGRYDDAKTDLGQRRVTARPQAVPDFREALAQSFVVDAQVLFSGGKEVARQGALAEGSLPFLARLGGFREAVACFARPAERSGQRVAEFLLEDSDVFVQRHLQRRHLKHEAGGVELGTFDGSPVTPARTRIDIVQVAGVPLRVGSLVAGRRPPKQYREADGHDPSDDDPDASPRHAVQPSSPPPPTGRGSIHT